MYPEVSIRAGEAVCLDEVIRRWAPLKTQVCISILSGVLEPRRRALSSIHPWPPPILARTPFRRVIIENLPAASVRNDLISIGKSRPRPRSRRAELDPGPQRIGRKVAFRDPLLALYKSPSIDERRNDGRSSRYRARAITLNVERRRPRPTRPCWAPARPSDSRRRDVRRPPPGGARPPDSLPP